MFGSSVLEVAIGLTFCYGTVALIVATLQEALAAAFRLRANTLLAGIKSMLNDPRFDALAQMVYAHPLVNPHSDGSPVDERHLAARPSYIEPAHFAIALIDSIQKVPGDFARLGADIDAIRDPQIRRALHALHARAAGDLERFQLLVAGWFDNAMERVSGAYKRRQLLISLLLSLLLAILFNIDSINLFRTLWQQPQLAAHIGGGAGRARRRNPAPAVGIADRLGKLPAGAGRGLRPAGGRLADHGFDHAVRRAVLVRFVAACGATARHRGTAAGNGDRSGLHAAGGAGHGVVDGGGGARHAGPARSAGRGLKPVPAGIDSG